MIGFDVAQASCGWVEIAMIVIFSMLKEFIRLLGILLKYTGKNIMSNG
jgi:hypothetical protein